MEAVYADILRTQPNVRFPEEACRCKDPHVRIRHDHGLLCVEAPRLAGEIGKLAHELSLPTAPELSVPAFDLRPPRARAPETIDVEASYAAIVREARASGWTRFEDGSADVPSVAYALTGSPCPVGTALLALSKIEETPVRVAVRELAETVYVGGSRLQAIARHIMACGGSRAHVVPRIQSIVECLREIGKSLQELDAQIRETCLFDPTPRRCHSRDIVYQEVVTALAVAEFDTAEIARLIVPTSGRDPRLWRKRVRDHVRNADRRDFGAPAAISLELGVPSRLTPPRRPD